MTTTKLQTRTPARSSRRLGGISDTLIDDYDADDFYNYYSRRDEGPELGDYFGDSPDEASLLAVIETERAVAAADVVFC